MRKLLLLSLFTIAVAFPLAAADTQHGRGQSYLSFDDGGTTIRQGDDGQEVEGRLNFPVYPGDEIITNRRGRTEIRLSDGNVLALDRSTDVVIKSSRDSYDGDANLTVVELKYGHVMVERDDDGTEAMRIDTEGASYSATQPAIYAIDNDRGHDRVAVFDGEVEVRTPTRTTRMSEGQSGHVDEQGLYDVVNEARGGADDFERWFIRRAQLYRGSSSRYLDHSLAYSDRDLDNYGSWVYVSDYGSWCWRPRVEVGWRPYFYGSWHYGRGSLVWISYEPWGWVPYHYGRWSYDPFYGWVWMPGYAYSPAWVYWMYGPSYVGWAPAGWFDCYRPYYGWAYRPYAHIGRGWNGGFYGRVRLHDIDLRPWTFVNPGSMVSTRVDRAALNVDAIRGRLSREGGIATVTNGVARFNRSELRDPAAAVGAIARRGLGSGTGKGSSGTVADMTSFFRRDPELSSAVRERVIAGRPSGGALIQPGSTIGGTRGAPSGVPTPGTSGTLEGRVPRDGGGNKGNSPMIDGGINRVPGTGTVGDAMRSPTVDRNAWRNRNTGSSTSGATNRSNTPPPDRSGVTPRGNDGSTLPPSDRGSWRNRDNSQGQPQGNSNQPPPERRRSNNAVYDGGSWRGNPGGSTTSQPNSTTGRDVPRRIIDSIGGSRIYSGERPSHSRSGDTPRYSPPPSRSSSPPPSRSSGSSNNGGSHSSGNSGSHNEHHRN